MLISRSHWLSLLVIACALLGCASAPRVPVGSAPATAAARSPRARQLAAGQRDSDHDCIPDHREDRNGDGVVNPGETDPHRVDTDRDGLYDGFEDRNCNGRQDRNETSPTQRDSDRDGVGDGIEFAVTHTDPLRPNTNAELRTATRTRAGRHDAVQVPEPMIFDLARSLGARAGELEVNTLVVLHRQRGHLQTRWAPEVEWAFARGYTLELELPFHDDALDAVKVAAQGTFGVFGARRFIHGWQLLNELALDDGALTSTLLYLLGARIDERWSAFAMLGGRSVWSPVDQSTGLSFIANASVFADLNDRLAVGFEANTVWASGDWQVTVVPQVHASLVHWLKFQVGVGVDATPAGVGSVVAARLIVER